MNKIPKIIHYCWFGRGKKPKKVKECIKTWEKYLYDYKIIEWNEDNFDINLNIYVKQAYDAKKYAFVSDYVRLYVLYNYGGIYMDTDVEVLKSLDTFLKEEAFIGFEYENFCGTAVIGACKSNLMIKKFMQIYKNSIFLKEDGSFNEKTNVVMITEECVNYGMRRDNTKQNINGLTIYPKTYFSPLNYDNIDDDMSQDTYTIHHFSGSWLSKKEQNKIKQRKKYQIRKKFLCKFMSERSAYIILDFKLILKNKLNS